MPWRAARGGVERAKNMRSLTQAKLLRQLEISARIWFESRLPQETIDAVLKSQRSFAHSLLIGMGHGYDEAERLAKDAIAKGRAPEVSVA